MKEDEKEKEKPLEVEVVPSSEAYLAQTRGEIDVQIQTAKRYPRELSRVLRTIETLATVDQETAERCWYSLPRAGKNIEGPSVRLAEIIASSWGNLRVGFRVVGMDEKHVICQGMAHDLESNVLVQAEVRRRITDKNGKRFSDDMIVVTSNAAGSIALRNAIFKVVPMGVFHGILAKVKAVGMGDERTLVERRKAAMAHFEAKGFKRSRILALLDRKAEEDVTVEDLATLRGYINAADEESGSLAEIIAEAEKAKGGGEDPAQAGFQPGRMTLGNKGRAPQEPAKEKVKD